MKVLYKYINAPFHLPFTSCTGPFTAVQLSGLEGLPQAVKGYNIKLQYPQATISSYNILVQVVNTMVVT